MTPQEALVLLELNRRRLLALSVLLEARVKELEAILAGDAKQGSLWDEKRRIYTNGRL